VPGPGAYAPPEACVASQTLSARELLAWTYPRGAGRSLHDRRNCYRSSDGRPRGCASGLVDGLHGLAARCGNWPIRALKRWAQTWARIAAAEIVIWVQWRVADVSATRPLLIYLAGVLFPEGAVAGGRRSPLSFHSITSSARASSVCGTSRPSALAVERLITNSNLLDWTTGRSAGLAPWRIRPV
jgi:hypothetical protein